MKIDVNNITINYVKEGDGDPLLFLHGNNEDLSIFNKLIGAFKNYYTVYAIDSRNHGESSKTDDFRYETMAEDIFQFVDKLGLKDVSVVGFSDGAISAVLAELSHPGLFAKMVLLGINLKPSDFKEECIEYLESEYEKTKDPLLKLMLEEPNIELQRLNAIKAPVLVVRAEDELFCDTLYDNIVKTIPSAELLIMKGHDHGSYIVESDALYEDVFKFLKQ